MLDISQIIIDQLCAHYEYKRCEIFANIYEYLKLAMNIKIGYLPPLFSGTTKPTQVIVQNR